MEYNRYYESEGFKFLNINDDSCMRCCRCGNNIQKALIKPHIFYHKEQKPFANQLLFILKFGNQMKGAISKLIIIKNRTNYISNLCYFRRWKRV